MLSQDLLGQAYPFSDQRPTDDGRRRETSLWRVRRAARSENLRPPAPSRRAARAQMPRRAFLALAFGWMIALAALLAVVLAVRWLG